MTKFDELANKNTREQLADMFGASVPTVQRWFSDSKTPKYVDIIIAHLEKIEELKSIAYEYSSNLNDMKISISDYRDAQLKMFSHLK